MSNPSPAALLERVAMAGVAITTRALSRGEPRLRPHLPQWRVLVVLGEERDGATVSEVAARMGAPCRRPVAGSGGWRRGLVALDRDERDRRAARAPLTADGRATRRAILDYRR